VKQKESKARVKKEVKQEKTAAVKKEQAKAEHSDNGSYKISQSFLASVGEHSQIAEDEGDNLDLVIVSSNKRQARPPVVPIEAQLNQGLSGQNPHQSDHAADLQSIAQTTSSNILSPTRSPFSSIPSFRRAFTNVRWSDFL
jgi:hypothetical protein